MLVVVSLPAFATAAPGVPVSVAPGVPDQGRAWELITPADSTPGVVAQASAISVAGDRVAYLDLGLLPGATSGGPFPSANIAVRGAEGWTNSPVPVPFGPVDGFPGSQGDLEYGGPQALTADLTTWLGIRHLPLQPGQTENDVGLLRWGLDGTATLLANLGPHGDYIGASADGARVFFTTDKHLLPADATRTSGRSIYEAFGSTIRLADVGTGNALVSGCGSTEPLTYFAASDRMIVRSPVISRDGRRVFFSTHPSCTGPQRVFLRENGTDTTDISASQCDLADCGPEADVRFVEATPSGSVVFLCTAERLTDEDTNSLPDFYRYDVASGDLKLFAGRAPGVESGLNGSGPFSGSAKTTQDGSKLYFIVGNQPNFKLFLAEASGTRLVAPASLESERMGWIQTSADGRYAVFMSAAPLVAGDSDEAVDVYRYDTEEDSLTEISTGPMGGNGPFPAASQSDFLSEGAPSYQFRSVSDDGGRIFFETAEQLVPEDRNAVGDVYEWADGKLGLISSGAGGFESQFVGATEDGKTVFFRTPQTLLGRDRDGGDQDLYAARVGGGFPEPVVVEKGECEGAGCGSSARAEFDRSLPDSAKAGAARIELGRIDAAARRRIVASGTIALLVEVPQGGRLAVTALARLDGRRQTVAATTTTVAKAGPVQLQMRLSKAARRELAGGRSLQVRLLLRLSGLGPDAESRFALMGAK